jgi:bifunctional non-homologous end joining protein LigD
LPLHNARHPGLGFLPSSALEYPISPSLCGPTSLVWTPESLIGLALLRPFQSVRRPPFLAAFGGWPEQRATARSWHGSRDLVAPALLTPDPRGTDTSYMSLLRMRARPYGFGLTEPCQPSSIPRPPEGLDWLHEIKHDGYRLIACREAVGIRLITRNGLNWSDRYPAVVEALRELSATSCILDGEVAVPGPNGVTSFDLLRRGPWVKPDAVLCAFDLIELNGEDLRRQPIERRKERLQQLVQGCDPDINYVDHVCGDGAAVFERACSLGLEGIVSKRLGSTYRSGRSLDWRKSENPYSDAARRQAESV